MSTKQYAQYARDKANERKNRIEEKIARRGERMIASMSDEYNTIIDNCNKIIAMADEQINRGDHHSIPLDSSHPAWIKKTVKAIRDEYYNN